nr:CheR family methyltransferase [uncultured Carboxylicivirga sp.]
MALNYSIRELRELSVTLAKETKLPIDQMSQSFLKRRLYLFGEKKGIKRNEQLIAGLKNEVFKEELISSVVVPVTELFRDAGVWRKIRDHFLTLSNQAQILVWIPQISSGEELYTLLIIAKETGVLDKLDITAGYCASDTKELVEKGILISKKMDTNLYNYKRYEGKAALEDYIEEENGSIKLKSSLLKKVRFKKGCVTEGQPDSKVDLVLFRNVMLYYKKDYHIILKDEIDKCLKPGGWLCLGVREQLPNPFSDRFECIDSKEKIYNKYNALIQ